MRRLNDGIYGNESHLIVRRDDLGTGEWSLYECDPHASGLDAWHLGLIDWISTHKTKREAIAAAVKQIFPD
jgi:hypothetical protein